MDNKELRQQVYDAINRAGLRSYRESLESVLEKGIIFTKAQRIQEIIDVVKDIDGLSLTGERFFGFSNGILFTIKKCWFFLQIAIFLLINLRFRAMDDRERIGLMIATSRKEKGLSQRDLAGLTGLNYTNIWKIEKGKYSVGLDILSKICKALGKRVDIVDIPGNEDE